MTEITKDEIELRKYEAKLSLWRTGIIGGIVAIMTAMISGFASVYVSSQETKKEIELQVMKSQHELQLKLVQVENDYVARFMQNALAENVATRLRFAQYMSIVSPGNEEQRKRWMEYYKITKDEYDSELDKARRLEEEINKTVQPTANEFDSILKEKHRLEEQLNKLMNSTTSAPAD